MKSGLDDIVLSTKIGPRAVAAIGTGIIAGASGLAYQLLSGAELHPLPGAMCATSLFAAYLGLTVVRVRNEYICRRIENEGIETAVRNPSMTRYAEVYAQANGKMDDYNAALQRCTAPKNPSEIPAYKDAKGDNAKQHDSVDARVA